MCERPDAYHAEERTARLVHQCYSCGGAIVRGEVYHYASGVWDGRGDDFKRHLLCAVLEEQQDGGDGCWEFGSLLECGEPSGSWVMRQAWNTVMWAAGRLPEEEEE